MTFVGLMCIPAFRNTAISPTDRARWMKLLRDDRPAERYRSVMRGWLDWLDTRLSAHEAQQGPAQRAWSFGLLNFTMALALAYPILAITVQWLAGYAIDFGGQEVIAASPLQARIFVPVWLGSSLILCLFAARSKPRWQWPLLILASGILFLGLFYADSFSVPKNLTIPVVVAVAVAVAVAVPGAFAFAVAIAFADAFAIVATPIFTVAFTVAEEPSRHPLVWRLLYYGVLMAGVVVVIKMLDVLGGGQRNRAVFLMLTLSHLPLFNALFDFVSAGLTRHLLRMGLDQKRAAWRAVLDGLGGIAIFFALGCALIIFITFVIPADGVPLLDLAQLFANLRSAPGDYIWLMITLFSTLLPTLVHLSIAALTMALQYPAWWRNFVAGLLENGAQSRQAALFSGICICAMITVALWSPIWFFAFVITHDHGATFNTVLWIFETFAWAIGGI
ncbi:MAG: hypothetical protein ACPH3J_06315 [Planktomarina sp.]|uniref:hypothetical protein n=2 Tax=Planktomarina sp. TaxID=2024851 RepID=UPI003C5D3F47